MEPKRLIPYSVHLPEDVYKKLKEAAGSRKASALVRDAIDFDALSGHLGITCIDQQITFRLQRCELGGRNGVFQNKKAIFMELSEMFSGNDAGDGNGLEGGACSGSYRCVHVLHRTGFCLASSHGGAVNLSYFVLPCGKS